MKGFGLMIKLTGKEHIPMLTVLIITENGLMINSTVLGWNLGLMVQSTKVITPTAKKKAKVNLLSLMVATMKENLDKTKYADMVNTIGQTESNMMESGVITKCTATEH